jgi:hypothetical protein
MTERKKRLTAKTKFEIYLKTRATDAPIGEVLREYGLHLNDLRKIEEIVERHAIAGLKTNTKYPKNAKEFKSEDYRAMQDELEQKDKALADLTVQYMILKKNDA